jgi:hypothetical protein
MAAAAEDAEAERLNERQAQREEAKIKARATKDLTRAKRQREDDEEKAQAALEMAEWRTAQAKEKAYWNLTGEERAQVEEPPSAGPKPQKRPRMRSRKATAAPDISETRHSSQPGIESLPTQSIHQPSIELPPVNMPGFGSQYLQSPALEYHSQLSRASPYALHQSHGLPTMQHLPQSQQSWPHDRQYYPEFVQGSSSAGPAQYSHYR